MVFQKQYKSFNETAFSLTPPPFEDFDGGAGQLSASREVHLRYPPPACFPAGMIEGSRVVDAPATELTLDEMPQYRQELLVWSFVYIYSDLDDRLENSPPH
jgi:hypothetical protein